MKKQENLTYEEYAMWRETHSLKSVEIDKNKENTKNQRKIKETAVAETLRIAKILATNGVDLSKIKIKAKKTIDKKYQFILLEEIEQDGIDIQRIIEENNLDGKFKYGMRISKIRDAYNGIEYLCKMTEEEKKEIEELGLVRKTEEGETKKIKTPKVETPKVETPKTENSIAETLRIAKILVANGVELNKIKLSKTVNNEKKYILLEDIEQDGIDMQRIIEENNLDGKFKYGMRIVTLKSAYNGAAIHKVTKEQKMEIDKLNLIKKPKEMESGNNKGTSLWKALKIAQILKTNGVDLSTLELFKKVNERMQPMLLGELKQDGVDIQKIIEENKLDSKFEIGAKIIAIRKAYNGLGVYDMEKKERQTVEELGLIPKPLMEKQKQKQQAIRENKQVKKLLEEYKKLEEQQK